MIRVFCFVLFTGLFNVAFPQTPTNYLMGKTTGVLPYLEFGLGSDRLGGAKIGFLDTGIVIKVADSTQANYKVQLSRNHFAYLQKSNFQKDSNTRLSPYYLTNSWLVYGDEKYDYVSLGLDEKLPYKSIQQIDPSRIVIDIMGVTSNTNWITQRSTAKEIKNAYYEQVEDDVFRVFIDLKHDQHWGYSIYYEGKKLVIKVKRQPPDLSLANLKIAIDAGHGGDNSGAAGVTSNIQEKKYTLLIPSKVYICIYNCRC